MKTQTFERKATFPVKTKFWHIFSSTLKHEKIQGTFYKGPEDLLTIFAQFHFLGPQKSLETNISKKAVCQLADNFPHSFLYYRVSPRATFY